MKRLLLAGAAFFAMAPSIEAQTSSLDDGYVYELDCFTQEDGTEYCEKVLIGLPSKPKIDDFVLAKGVKIETDDQPEVIDILPSTSPEGLTLAHPAELLNLSLIHI